MIGLCTEYVRRLDCSLIPMLHIIGGVNHHLCMERIVCCRRGICRMAKIESYVLSPLMCQLSGLCLEQKVC